MICSRKNSFTNLIGNKAVLVRNIGLRDVGKIWVMALIFGLFVTLPQAGRGAPCTTTCGPGPHWVDFCIEECEEQISNTSAIVGIDLDFDCVPDVNLVLSPCGPPDNFLEVYRSGARDDSQNFPGLRNTPGHLDVIDTEILKMCQTAGGITLRAGAGQGIGP